MFYKLSFDMDRVDESIKEGTNTIYAESTNMDDIVYEDVKKGFLITLFYPNVLSTIGQMLNFIIVQKHRI